jgi:hypothetical protein
MKPSESGTRQHERFASYRNLLVVYEGSSLHLPVKPPDISARGMFINTAREFQVGAVLKISFWLVHADFEVHARGEVRYCLPGVGVGVEFIHLPEQARRAIEEEISRLAPAPQLDPAQR